jgi:peptidoglycan/xylan/chitin deacetylase (PgdA/CDA1 family)
MSLRLDRLITLHLTAPVRRLCAGTDASIPILMYHSISDEPEPKRHAYFRTNTSPRIFAEQMECLHRSGYSVASLSDGIMQLKNGVANLAKQLVITFDDGFADFYRSAFPVLHRYGFQATMYLPTAHIADNRSQFKRKECLTWDEVRELSRHGIKFGSHTVTHPLLRTLSPAAVNEEIAISKKTIENKLGLAVESFAYPYAFPQTDSSFKRVLRDSLESAGYQNGVCTIVGRANCDSDRFFLERLPINSADDDALFGAKLAGAYDWIGRAQRLAKTFKAQIGNLTSSKTTRLFSSTSNDAVYH